MATAKSMARIEPPPLAGGSRGNIEKVAILLAALDTTLAVDLLKRFKPDDVKRIMSSTNRLGPLKTSDVAPLVDEFADEFSKALGISAGPQQLVALLESAFSAEQVAELLGRKKAVTVESAWVKLASLPDTVLVPFLMDEHEQIAAYVLTKLPAELAAKCLTKLPKDNRNRIAQRIVKFGHVEDDADEVLQQAILEDLFAKSVTVDEGASSEKLAAVINQMERPITEEIFAELNRSMPEDIKRLRGLVFMFEDIVNLEQKDRSKLFDRAPTDQVIPALFGCTAELREAILSSLSARSRRMVESELQGDTSQPQPGTAAAQRKLADLAIQMSKAGEITLRSAPPADGPAATAAAPEAA